MTDSACQSGAVPSDLVRLLVSDLLTMPDSPGSDLRDLAGRLTARQQRGLFVDREGPLTWEPPIGIEPMTYALRVRRSNRLS